jgi:hypothetical protein
MVATRAVVGAGILGDYDYLFASGVAHDRELSRWRALSSLCEFRWIARRISVPGVVGFRADDNSVLHSLSKFTESNNGTIALFKLLEDTTRRRLTVHQLASVVCAHLALRLPVDIFSNLMAFSGLRSVRRGTSRSLLLPMEQCWAANPA